MSSPNPSREGAAPPRPRQVTMAVGMSIVIGLVLLVSLFDTLARLRSPESRAAIEEVLSTRNGRQLGIDAAQIIDILRVMVYISGALTATAIVFAVFILQRHRAARVGFTVCAALLVLTVPATGLLPVFLAVALIPLWSRPARDWYAGRAPAPVAPAVPVLSQSGGQGGPYPAPGAPPSPGSEPLYGPPGYTPPPYAPPYPPPYGQPGQGQPGQGQPAYPQPDQPPASQPVTQPGAQPGAQPRGGQPVFGQPTQSPGYGQPVFGQPAYGSGYQAAPRDPDRRPVTVTVAAVLTWIAAGVTALLMLLFLLVLAVSGDAFVEEFQSAAPDQELTLTPDQIMAVGWGVGAVMLFWSLAAIVLAVLAFRRSNPARITLVVSAAMTVLLSLVAIMSVITLVPLILAVAVLILLFAGGSNAWYSRRPAGGPVGPVGGWPGQAPQQERPKPW